MNILISDICNRKCPFCFADCSTKVTPSKFMSLDDIRTVIKFLRKSNINVFRCIGGEPSLHPKFIEIIDIIIDSGLRLMLFTNGVMSKRKVDKLYELYNVNKLQILCNITKTPTDTAGQLAQREYFFSKLALVSEASITIHEPLFDYGYILDIIKTRRMMPRVRIGIAHPIAGVENTFLHKEDFKEFSIRLQEMVKDAAQHCIFIGTDCGMPMCIGGKNICNPIIDVGVNLDVWSCFPLRGVNVRKLSDFEDYSHAYSYYLNKFHKYRKIPLFDECVSCQYADKCHKGCVAHKINGT